MKTQIILTVLLIAAAVSAEARFASPYPRKTVSPDEIGDWVVINGNPWPHRAASESNRRHVVILRDPRLIRAQALNSNGVGQAFGKAKS